MIHKKIQLGNIPAILYGPQSDKLYIFVHGKQSRKEESESFSEIAAMHGWQVISFDLPQHGERSAEEYPCTPWNSVTDLNGIYSFVSDKYSVISLYACSLGAYFCLLAYRDIRFDRCLFLSPVLDMERLIRNMMKWSGISAEELKAAGEHATPFGETLSWDYYEYVRNHPLDRWTSPTFILYGEEDNLTERTVLDAFAAKFRCHVDIMPGGEHYFHTKEQSDYLKSWLQNVIE